MAAGASAASANTITRTPARSFLAAEGESDPRRRPEFFDTKPRLLVIPRRQTIDAMSSPPPPNEDPGAPAVDELYLRWLEWVTINLGRDNRLASRAAHAATEAALQGAGFNAAVDAARKAWVSETTSHARSSVDWLGGIGRVIMFVSIPAVIAVVAGLGIGLSTLRDGGGGPIVMCPDMCGAPQVPAPTLSADLTRWTPGGVELAGTITASAGLTCARPTVQVGFFDGNGASVGVIEIDFVTPVAGDQTLNWDVKFWPPPYPGTPIAYTLADGTAITERDGLTGPIPAATVVARIVNVTCVEVSST